MYGQLTDIFPEGEDTEDDETEGAEEQYMPTEREIGQVVQRGLAAAAKGENVDYLLEVMQALFPPGARAEIAKRFSLGLAQRKLAPPAEDPGVAPRSKLVRLHRMFVRIIEQQAVARISALIRRSNQIASDIVREGERLAGNNVTTGGERVTTADLNTISPSAGTNADKKRTDTREI